MRLRQQKPLELPRICYGVKNEKIVVGRETYAAVAAKFSNSLAFVTVAKVKANTIMNDTMAPNRARGLVAKYNANIEAVGRSAESAVPIILTAVVIFSSSYS